MKVFVGLSGGVDSAVSAALLKEQGHSVTGVFIKVWQPEFIECSWREDRLDAMRVAVSLGIPFHEIDLSDKYKREVVEKIIADYAAGITPNPDVLCNSSIKFGHFLRWALGEGAEMIATGHYACIRRSDDQDKFGFRKPKDEKYMGLRNPYILLRGEDKSKNQSYFLWQLGQEELSRSLFPIGDLKKSEVRALAKRFGLPNAEKPDSQGLCFVGDVTMEDFLARFIPMHPGAVVDMSGKYIGEHRGAALYTVGQRHGFVVRHSESPYYVVSVDPKTNTIVVSPRRDNAARNEAILTDTNWIAGVPEFPLEAEGEARYREVPVPVRIEGSSECVRVTFFEPHVIAPGQSLVLYKGEQCIGGGVLSR